MTIHALDQSDLLQEGNPFLNDRPSNRALITHKMIIAPLVEQNMNYYQLEFINLMLEVAVYRNLYIMDKYGAF